MVIDMMCLLKNKMCLEYLFTQNYQQVLSFETINKDKILEPLTDMQALTNYDILMVHLRFTFFRVTSSEDHKSF